MKNETSEKERVLKPAVPHDRICRVVILSKLDYTHLIVEFGARKASTAHIVYSDHLNVTNQIFQEQTTI